MFQEHTKNIQDLTFLLDHIYFSITLQHLHVNVLRLEPGGHDVLNHVLIKPLATENVQVGIARVIAKMSRYITSLYQLHKGISSLISFSKVLDHGPTKSFHIDPLDQVGREELDVAGVHDGDRLTLPCIDNAVPSPM
jgi:hypothetical protein